MSLMGTGKSPAMHELVLVALLLGLSAAVWLVLLARRRAGQAFVLYEARRPVPWGLLDVFLALTLLVFLTSVALATLGDDIARRPDEPLDPDAVSRQLTVILAQALVSLTVVVVSVGTIWLRYRATGADLGWSAAKVRSDIWLGVIAFLALAPPVYAIQMCLVQWFESKHPLIELIRYNPQPPLIAAVIVSAVAVAPLVEEYLFRGLLQGWLERLADGHDDPLVLILGRADQAPSVAAPGAARWPVAVSAFTFAILHVTHGPDWIPLFVLALGLGYLYRQTHRLLPAIVVHGLLNACSLLVLLVS